MESGGRHPIARFGFPPRNLWEPFHGGTEPIGHTRRAIRWERSLGFQRCSNSGGTYVSLVASIPYSSEAHTPEPIDILKSYVSQNVPLITHVLFNQVRPVFQSHVHPKVNPSTGRVLNRVAGGPLASQDLYSSQSWKESHPGISNVLFWVVAHIEVKASHVAHRAYT
jgi:hypothetical protein